MSYQPTAAQLADWMLHTMGYDEKDRMAEEVAVQMPSPGEFEHDLDVPDRAKVLRRTLLREIEDAESTEAAREVLFRMAEALTP